MAPAVATVAPKLVQAAAEWAVMTRRRAGGGPSGRVRLLIAHVVTVVAGERADNANGPRTGRTCA